MIRHRAEQEAPMIILKIPAFGGAQQIGLRGVYTDK